MVALKVAKVKCREKAEALEKEYALLKTLNHVNVVKAEEFLQLDKRAILVMKYLPGKSLDDASVRAGQGLNEKVGMAVASDLCDAVDYIAKQGIVHRDIMPRNVVLQMQRGRSGIVAVLVDFGSACQPQHSVMVSKAGTADYSSPEMNAGLVYGHPVDVWGVGATIAAAMYGAGFDILFDLSKIAVVDQQALQFNGSGWLVDLQSSFSSPAAAFVEAACTVSPGQRPTIGELRGHPFLRGPRTSSSDGGSA
jgi:serine/threonine protein kinase